MKGKETHLCIVSLAMKSDPHGKKYFNLNPTYKSRTRFAVKELKYLIAHSHKQSASQRKRVEKIFPNVQQHSVCFQGCVPYLRS